MDKISKISRLIKALIVFLAFLHLFTFVVLAFAESGSGASKQVEFDNGVGETKVSASFDGPWQDIAIALENDGLSSTWLLGTVEALPYLIIYFFLFRLFSLYQQGIIFSPKNIHCIKSIGTTLLAWIAVSLFYPMLLVFALRGLSFSDNLPLTFNIGSTEITYLISGLVIYVIAWVMNEALRLKDDQELVI